MLPPKTFCCLALTTFVFAIPLERKAFLDITPLPGSGYSSSSWAPSSFSPGQVTFPLPNGFPNVQNPSPALTSIELQAHGTLPNAPPPSTPPSEDTFVSLRLIAFNEIWEVFFFESLLQNVTNNVPGFTVADQALRQQIIDALTAVVGQEQLHALNANGALQLFNAGPIQACQYKNIPSSLEAAFSLASTFTDVVVGTLQDVAVALGKDGNSDLIRGIAAVIGQEGAQDGFYRSQIGRIPSALPFLTAASREFAFSALNQQFIVPNSCPNANTIALPIFGTLTVLTSNVLAENQDLQFSIEPQHGETTVEGYSLVYINQQNVPVVQALSGGQVENGQVVFSSSFPYTEYEMNGLTLVAIVNGSNVTFADVDAVSKAALYGPGLIEIN